MKGGQSKLRRLENPRIKNFCWSPLGKFENRHDVTSDYCFAHFQKWKCPGQNGYPAGVVYYNINDVLNREQNKPGNPTTTVAKKETILVLPYLGVKSYIVTNSLRPALINSMAALI